MTRKLADWSKRWGPFVGGVVGVAGFLLAGFSLLQTQRTPLDVSLEQSLFAQRSVLDASIVNGALHPTNLVGGAVLWRGTRVGTVVALQQRSDAGVDFASAEEVRAVASRLPVSIPAGASLTGRLLWDDEPTLPPATTARLDRLFGRARTSGERPFAHDIEVRLEFDRGGTKTERVALPFEAGRPADRATAAGWDVQPCFARATRRVNQVFVLPRRTGPAVTRLQLWRDDASRAIHEIERPAAEDRPTLVPLPRLPAGRYLWALTADGTTVAAGDFRTPYPRGGDPRAAVLCRPGGGPHR